MSDVKYIFRWLIGTIVVMAVVSILIEYFNVLITSVQINNLSKTACYQACTLATQETWKQSNTNGTYWGYRDAMSHGSANVTTGAQGGTLALPDIVYGEREGLGAYSDGGSYNYSSSGWHSPEYISGQLLSDSMTGTSWAGMMSDDFYAKLVNTPGIKDAYSEFAMFDSALNKYKNNGYKELKVDADNTDFLTGVYTDASGNLVVDYSDFEEDYFNRHGAEMVNNQYTPCNFGIPYIAQYYTSAIFRWETGMIFSSGNMNNVHSEFKNARGSNFRFNNVDENMYGQGSGGHLTIVNPLSQRGYGYIGFKGFKIYAQDALIEDVSYEVYDLIDDEGNLLTSVAQQLEAKANIKVVSSSEAYNGYGIYVKPTYSPYGTLWHDNAAVTLANVDYSIPITYEGITPIGGIVGYIQNHHVGDTKGNTIGSGEGVTAQEVFENHGEILKGNSSIAKYSSKNAVAKGVPSTGSVVFTLIR